MTDIAKTDRRCPRCRSRDLHLIELTVCSATWEVRNGVFDMDDGVLEPGETTKVLGRCLECEHEWRLRNALHIDQVCCRTSLGEIGQ